jgi:hypothetical protein
MLLKQKKKRIQKRINLFNSKHNKMKNIFTKEEIRLGMALIRNDVGKPIIDNDFARTVTMKVSHSVDNGKVRYGVSFPLSCGLYAQLGSMDDVLEYINEDRFGYRPITKEEYIQLVESSNQNFY